MLSCKHLLVAAALATSSNAAVVVFDTGTIPIGPNNVGGVEGMVVSEINLSSGTATIHSIPIDGPASGPSPGFGLDNYNLGNYSLQDFGSLNFWGDSISVAKNGTTSAFRFYALGQSIDSGSDFGPSVSQLSSTLPMSGTSYLGLKLDVGLESYYGWLRLDFYGNGGVETNRIMSINGFAFNNVAGESLLAGTGLSGGAIPEPSTYGLALGGLVLAGAVMRRRKISK